MGNTSHKILLPSSESTKKPLRPALTSDAREQQLISLAMDLAEKQLREGTASSQVITQFLKLGSSREKLEQEKLQKDKELIDAKKEALASTKDTEKLYMDALKAMRTYSGSETNQPTEGDFDDGTH